MRPPSHPAYVDLPGPRREGGGLLYEPGAHTLLFARPRERLKKPQYATHVLRLPWLLVGETHSFGDFYYACHALLFDDDPRLKRFSRWVSLSTVLGNSVVGRLCLGNSARGDLWNTAFSSETHATHWKKLVEHHDDDTREALRFFASDGVAHVRAGSAP